MSKKEQDCAKADNLISSGSIQKFPENGFVVFTSSHEVAHLGTYDHRDIVDALKSLICEVKDG